MMNLFNKLNFIRIIFCNDLYWFSIFFYIKFCTRSDWT